MRAFATLVIIALLAACARSGETPAPTAASVAPPVCRSNPQIGERGLGGTGVSAGDLQTAERGLGGTGIVGVITGFASICINNVEVAYDTETPVFVDGRQIAVDQLRAGQVVAIDSVGQQALHARKVSIIYQVSGRIDALPDSSDYGVSGQRIRPAEGAKLPTDAPLRPGDWVDVSGFRSQDGTISVTRIDRRSPGPATVRGRLTGVPGSYRIGDLSVRLPPGAGVAAGQWVVAEGSYDDNGILVVGAISPDLVASDPTALFAPNVTRFLIEGYMEAINGRLVSGSGWSMPTALQPGLGISAGRLSVIDIQRAPDGTLSTSGFHASPPLGIPGRPSGLGGPQQPLSGTPPFGGAPGGSTGGFVRTMPGGLPGAGGIPMGGGRPGR
jgi:hypothetical protein